MKTLSNKQKIVISRPTLKDWRKIDHKRNNKNLEHMGRRKIKRTVQEQTMLFIINCINYLLMIETKLSSEIKTLIYKSEEGKEKVNGNVVSRLQSRW